MWASFPLRSIREARTRHHAGPSAPHRGGVLRESGVDFVLVDADFLLFEEDLLRELEDSFRNVVVPDRNVV